MIRALCGCLPGQNSFSRGVGRRQALQGNRHRFCGDLGQKRVRGGSDRARRQAGGEVDRLWVRIVTDSLHRSLRGRIAGGSDRVRIDASAGVGSPALHPHALGRRCLSVFAKSTARGRDTAGPGQNSYSPEVLLTNLSCSLGCQAMVLSHGHFDHFGGLMGLLAAAKGKLNPTCCSSVARTASARGKSATGWTTACYAAQ